MKRWLVSFAFTLVACGQGNLVDSQYRDIRSLLSRTSVDGAIDPLAAPTLGSASPASIAMGGPDFVLTVNGSGFINQSVLRWNGQDRDTQFVSSGQLRANITASDIATPGLSSLTVFNPGEDGGESSAVYFAVFISQVCSDIIYDPVDGLIWASVPSIVGGNGVISIDPQTGERSSVVFVGSEPAKLAISDDGKSLFVALDGAAAVRQFDIPRRTAGIFFPVGRDSSAGLMFVEDMQVLPGYSDSVAISRRLEPFISPRHAGVGIYDFGVIRPTQTPGHTGSNVIQFSNSPDRLYGYSNEGDGGFRRMRVDDSGVTTLDSAVGLLAGGRDFRFDRYDERLYSTGGRVVDPEQRILLGTFPSVSSGSLVAPDSANGRTFYLTDVDHTLWVFDPNTFTPLGQARIPGISGTVASLIRWGDDGLAFRTGDQIIILTSPVPPMPPTGRRIVQR